jgi:hypothetical protein
MSLNGTFTALFTLISILVFVVSSSCLLAEMSILSTIQFTDNTTCFDVVTTFAIRYFVSQRRKYVILSLFLHAYCNTLARAIQRPKTCFYVSFMTPINVQILVFILVENEKFRFFALFYPLIHALICCMHVYTQHMWKICFIYAIFDFPALGGTRCCNICSSMFVVMKMCNSPLL